MNIEKSTFPSSKGTITLYRLVNATGASVTLSSLGAGIVSIIVPDRDGHMDDVVIGYNSPASYLYDGPCAGKIPGRFANRIANGRFSIGGKEYTLATNNGPNALHGGPEGFQNQIWECREIPGGVEFSYLSADGEEGYPGNLTVTATYTWNDDCELSLRMHAVTDATTVVNLTNHSYFNLDGESAGPIFDHELRMAASSFLPLNSVQVPTGEIAPVAGTPVDFLEFTPLGKNIHADCEQIRIAKGYDHCWVVDNAAKGVLRDTAWLRSPRSGRLLTIATTQPGMQVYTGNWLDDSPESISGHRYHDYDAVAIECQGFPDAPNKPSFPSSLLAPGEEYCETIVFKFSTI